jgi:Tfp pilus assembly protein PilV
VQIRYEYDARDVQHTGFELLRLLLQRGLSGRIRRRAGNQSWKDEGLYLERIVMELIMKKHIRRQTKESGMTLIELMIALVVLMVGIVGSVALIAYAISGNGRNKQQSNSVAVAQMITEKLSSQKASLSNNLTVTDCTGNSNTLFTGAGGPTLNSNGEQDFSAAAVTGYQMYYTDCGSNGRQMIYDVRWTITQPTTYTKLIIVSAQMKNAASSSNSRMYSPPVTIKTLVGQGT